MRAVRAGQASARARCAAEYLRTEVVEEAVMVLLEAWMVVVTERYAQFDGRAGRAEFWWYFLASFIISAILGILAQTSGIFNVISGIYGLAVLIPGLAVAVRRL